MKNKSSMKNQKKATPKTVKLAQVEAEAPLASKTPAYIPFPVTNRNHRAYISRVWDPSAPIHYLNSLSPFGILEETMTGKYQPLSEEEQETQGKLIGREIGLSHYLPPALAKDLLASIDQYHSENRYNHRPLIDLLMSEDRILDYTTVAQAVGTPFNIVDFDVYAEQRRYIADNYSRSSSEYSVAMKNLSEFVHWHRVYHEPIIEDIVAITTGATNILAYSSIFTEDDRAAYWKKFHSYYETRSLLKDKKDLLNHYTNRIMLDKGYLNFPYYMESRKEYGDYNRHPIRVISDILDVNTDFIRSCVDHLPNGSCDSKASVLNMKEWLTSFIDFLRGYVEYYDGERDLQAKPVYHPVPLRYILNVDVYFPELYYPNTASVTDIINMPSHVYSRYKSYLTKAFWDDTAFMIPLHELPWKYELAPQLWDIVYYSGTLAARIDTDGRPVKGGDYKKVNADTIGQFLHAMRSLDAVRPVASSGSAVPYNTKKVEAGPYNQLGGYYAFADRL